MPLCTFTTPFDLSFDHALHTTYFILRASYNSDFPGGIAHNASQMAVVFVYKPIPQRQQK